MSIMLRVLLVSASVLSLFYVIRQIRNSRMQIEYALFWILLSFVMIIMAIFPSIIYWITEKMGMISAANVVYLFIIAVLLLKVFMMTIELSSLENKVRELVQRLGIDEKERADERKQDESVDSVEV